jgi:trk system potassium uptake protein TrkA
MKVMIVGGGRLGALVAKQLRKEGQDIIIFEKDKETAEKIAGELDALVINADGTQIEKLEDAGLEEVDVFMALTGSDETNLMACQIAKGKAKRIIARANREENKQLYENAGVDRVLVPLVSSASAFRDAVMEKGKTLLALDRDFEIVEHTISRESKSLGKALKDLKFPNDARIVIIYRGDETIIPHGETILEEGDRVIVLTSQKKMKEVLSLL